MWAASARQKPSVFSAMQEASRKTSIMVKRKRQRLIPDLYAPPERNVVLDLLGGFFGLGIIPRGILIGVITNSDMIVAGKAFPRAGGVFLALLKVLFFDRIGREVMIPLDHDGLIRLSQYRVFP